MTWTLPNSLECVRCQEILRGPAILPPDLQNESGTGLFPDSGHPFGERRHNPADGFGLDRLLQPRIDPPMCFEGCGIDAFTKLQSHGILPQAPCPQHSIVILKRPLRGEKQVDMGYFGSGGVQAG